MEIMFRFDKAAVYQQERVASCKYDATCWYDYALFLMRTGDMGKAEEVRAPYVAPAICSTLSYLTRVTVLSLPLTPSPPMPLTPAPPSPPRIAQCTKEAIALQQGEFDYLFAHGCILATRGKYDDAEAYLKEALDLMPHDIEMWCG
eukprot:2300184-Prymnesium_polylepis.1